MLTNQEIEEELKIADFYYKKVALGSKVSKSYWFAGYVAALNVVFGLKESEIHKDILEFYDKDIITILQKREQKEKEL